MRKRQEVGKEGRKRIKGKWEKREIERGKKGEGKKGKREGRMKRGEIKVRRNNGKKGRKKV